MQKIKNKITLFNINKFLWDVHKKKQLLEILEIEDFIFPKHLLKMSSKNNNFLIFYIIEITYTKTNTFFYLKNPDGKLLVFCSAGSAINKKVKNDKTNRLVIVKAFFDILKEKLSWHKPVALHLVNVGSHSYNIIKKFKSSFFIKVIKIFNSYAYNGCRPRKAKRKKKFNE